MKNSSLLTLPLVFLFALWSGLASAQSPAEDFSKRWKEAEALAQSGAYYRALEIYQELLDTWDTGNPAEQILESRDRQELVFQKLDATWRAYAGRGEEALELLYTTRAELETLLFELESTSSGRPPELYARVAASLGAFHLRALPSVDWWTSWGYFEQALDWWAGSTDLETAGQAYLDLVYQFTRPAEQQNQNYQNAVSPMPIQVLDNFLRIAESNADRAYGNFLFAQSLSRQRQDARQRLRISQAYENGVTYALEASSPWLDDILYYYAAWSAREGNLYFNDQGNLVAEPDYAQAIRYYQELVNRFTERESQYVDDAQRALENIRKSHLAVSVSNVYLPESEVSFVLQSRNLEAVTVELYAIDLNQALPISRLDGPETAWLDAFVIRQLEPWKRYNFTPEPDQEYGPWNQEVRVDLIPEPGAYLVEARSGSQVARDILLVSSQTLVLKKAGRKTLVFMADALTGEPTAGAEVVFRQGVFAEDNPVATWEEQRGTTDASGLIQFEMAEAPGREISLVSAKAGTQQALAYQRDYQRRSSGEVIHAYAYADRSLYRPGDTVQWKVVFRNREKGGYQIPADETFQYEITGPQRRWSERGTVTTNAFGSAWVSSSLPASDKISLGVCTIQFRQDGKGVNPGVTELFRVEEVELPEFQVQIETRGAGDQPKTLFQLGDPVQVDIWVDYLSGGPVAGAEAEVLIFEDPYIRVEPLPYERSTRSIRPGRRGPGRVISRKMYQTDGEGAIEFSLPEPTLMNQDLEYIVEARVRDGSGAEVVSRQSIKMTRQPYYVQLEPAHRLYRPGDDVSIRISARDANENPVEVGGRLELERLVWEEIWIDPRGRQISGNEYHSLRNKRGFFSFGSSARDYRLLRRGYQVKFVDSTVLKTDAEGKVTFSRRVREEGYYRVRWISSDQTQVPIRSETHFFAADSASNDIGYHHGGLSIILDPARFEPGVSAPVMITTPVSNRWILLTVGDRYLDSARVLKMDGTVKLLDLTFEESQVPGTYLEATLVGELQVFQVRERVEVPPLANTLNISVEADQPSFLPSETASWEITVTDAEGNPAFGEISLAVVDEAGFQVQPDYGTDPLAFFYGEFPPFRIETTTTFNWKQYVDNKPMADPVPEGGLPFGSTGAGTRNKELETVYPASEEPQALMMQTAVSSPKAAMRNEAAMDSLASPPPAPGPPGSSSFQLRTHFESALYWDPALQPDADGKIRVEVPFSDSLTTWRATARGVSRENQFGEGQSTVRTRLPLIARLPLPDVLIQGDIWAIGGTVQNNEAEPREVTVKLKVEGSSFAEGSNPAEQTAVIPGRGQRTFTWKMRCGKPSIAHLEMFASTGEFGDRIQRQVVIQEHGMEKVHSVSGFASGRTGPQTLTIPEARRESSTEVEFVLASSLAPILREGFENLLADNAHTSEEYASRLLAALALRTAWQKQGISLSALAGIVPGIKPDGNSRELEAAWKDWIVKQRDGLQAMQLSDGSWPWAPHGSADLYMTAYVVWALNRVEAIGNLPDTAPAQRGREYLLDSLVEKEFSLNEQVWILHSLGSRFGDESPGRPSRVETEAFSNLWKNRDFLDSFGTALLARTAAFYGFDQETQILAENLSNGVIETTSGEGKALVHWAPGSRSLQFAQSRPETSALVLATLSQVKSESSWLDPAHRWLLRSRQAAGWRNTRETTFGILGLAAFFSQENPAKGKRTLTVSWNGEHLQAIDLGGGSGEVSSHRWVVDPQRLRDGDNTFSVTANESGPRFYYRATLRTFTLEEPIAPQGDVLQVARSFQHLKPRQTLLKGVVEDRVSLQGESYLVGIGERVESILWVTVDLPYPYLVLEDPLPAGFESARMLSGDGFFAVKVEVDEKDPELRESRITPEDRVPVYLEIREGKAVFLIDSLEPGTWEIRYALRAETEGRFHVLPTTVKTRYLPDVQGNSAEVHLRTIRRKAP